MGYRGKLHEQDHARRLRAKGWTMPDIAAELGVSRGSVSLWTRDMAFQPRLWKRPPGRRGPNALQRRKVDEINGLLAAGRERIAELSEQEFLVAGAALYAGEGSKTEGEVRFTNADPRMVAFFCAWLRHFFCIDEARLRLVLYLHQGLDIDAAAAYWSWVTAIPAVQHRRPYRPVADPSIRRAKHQFGCAAVGYSCSRTHRAVMGLVQALLSCDAIPG
jgi:hypothetical protein